MSSLFFAVRIAFLLIIIEKNYFAFALYYNRVQLDFN